MYSNLDSWYWYLKGRVFEKKFKIIHISLFKGQTVESFLKLHLFWNFCSLYQYSMVNFIKLLKLINDFLTLISATHDGLVLVVFWTNAMQHGARNVSIYM